MKIIGHRGAAGLALENTLESIRSAVASGVDAIEIDVRVTKDGHVVLSHDRSLGRVRSSRWKQLWASYTDSDTVVHKTSLQKLRRANLPGGVSVPTLHEALKAAGSTPLFIEGKSNGWAEPLAKALKHTRHHNITVISFNHQELFAFKRLCPDITVYALAYGGVLTTLRTAQALGFDGIDVRYGILNPVIYWLARRRKLDVVVFTVNRPWVARFLQLLYPAIGITTDVPHKMGFLSNKSRTSRTF
jgi:glycerophosphoryl diester phosphodiesterase